MSLSVWIGRDNRQRLRLLQDGEVVTEDAVARAQLRFGNYCIDTDATDDPIQLVDSATVVEMQLGLVPGLRAGLYRGQLTVFDNEAINGIAWQAVEISVNTWPVCG